MATTSIRSRYPRGLTLKGRAVTLRPLQSGDEAEVLAYFRRLPVDERRMLKDDVTDAATIARWCREIDYDAVLPILALSGARVVGNCTLHRHRGGWSAHVANLRITTDPAWRGLGLGTALVGEVVDAAYALGTALVDAEAMAEQTAAIRMLEKLDFVVVATLPHHALDLTQQPHDLVILTRTLVPAEQLSPDAAVAADEVDVGGG